MTNQTKPDPEDERSEASFLSKTLKALSLLSIDPDNLRGLTLKGRAGPIRESLFLLLPKVFNTSKLKKIYPSVSDNNLLGGIDFVQTFKTGTPTRTEGLLNSKNKTVLILSMADLLEPALIGKYTSAIDDKHNLCFIASDENVENEQISESLSDRLAFSVTTEGIHFLQQKNILFDHGKIDAARKNVLAIPITKNVISTFIILSQTLGISSLRGPMLACYAARAAAAFSGSNQIRNNHIYEAAELALIHRANIIPVEEDRDETNETSSPSENKPNDVSETQKPMIPPEMLLEAIKANLSPEALKELTDKRKTKSKKQNSSGFGQKKQGNRRGRPLPSREGKLDSANRLDIIETLKAAAPWQTIRRKKSNAKKSKILVQGSDLRVKRYEEKSDRLIIFTVDASGTAALGRLGETKGAIEILLAEAYAKRDQVALISFREKKATIELPPTRSLVQTKRRLAGLLGGGTTPLADALSVSYQLAMQARARGMTPTLALLTDGKGNIALDGTPGRQSSQTDVEHLSKIFRSANIPSILIDTSIRPQIFSRTLSQNLNAKYIVLPYADSRRLHSAVSAAIT